jgi:hypothetical protein
MYFLHAFLIELIKKTCASHVFKGHMSFLYVGCRKFMSIHILWDVREYIPKNIFQDIREYISYIEMKYIILILYVTSIL